VNKSMGALGGIVLLFFALLAAGCGGSSDEALTKAEFVKQGNAICTQARKAREKAVFGLIQNANPNGNQKALREEAADKAIPYYEEAAEQLADLGAPEGDEAKIEAIVTGMEEAAARVNANPQSAFTGSTPFRKANEAAESYGLEACVD